MKSPVLFQPAANRKGAVLIIVAAAILGLLGVVGLAIDLGCAYGVKGQLQAAADACALIGADQIFPGSSSSPEPQFIQAKGSTISFAKESEVAGKKLTDQEIVEVETGYWNLSPGRSTDELEETLTSHAGVCSENGDDCDSNSDCGEACLMRKVPAIKITMRKEVSTIFARVVGFEKLNQTVSAIAAIGYSKTARGIFPVAVGKGRVDQYFEQHPMPNPPPLKTIKLPYGGPAGSDSVNGQWTSLADNANDVPSMRTMIDHSLKDAPEGTASLPPMKLGDAIWIQPGAKSELFQHIASKCKDRVVELPVVQDDKLPNSGRAPIIGFVYFKIQDAHAPDQIIGHFEPYYKEAADNRTSGPGGPKYNALAHPLLVK